MDRIVTERSHDGDGDRWRVTTAAPAAALAGAVDRYVWWSEHTTSFAARRELASTQGVFIVNLGAPLEIVDASGALHRLRAGEGFAGGMAQATSLSRNTGPMEGVHVHGDPTMLARLLGVPIAALSDRVAPLDALIGRAATELGERLQAAPSFEARWRVLDAFVATRLATVRPPDREIAHARTRLRRGDRVEAVAADLGWSRKRLARQFRDATGLVPRAYAGLARFERFTTALLADPRRPLAHAALDAGYADQAHLTREVARYAALTPAGLRARLIPAGGGVRD